MRPTERTISTGRLRSRPFVRIWSFPEELDRDDRFTDSAKLTPHSRLPPVEFGTRIAAWGEAVKEPQSGGCPTHRPTHGFLSFLMYCEATRSSHWPDNVQIGAPVLDRENSLTPTPINQASRRTS